MSLFCRMEGDRASQSKSKNLTLSKPLFDSLHFWIDDVTQLLEQTVASSSNTSYTTWDNQSQNLKSESSRKYILLR
jgi:hypothetical protein